MVEKVKPGMYRIGEAESSHHRDPPKRVGVAKGEQINKKKLSSFPRHMGVANSKWYVYENTEYLREYYDQSGTGVLDVKKLVEEFDSKKEAINYAEKKYNFTETY